MKVAIKLRSRQNGGFWAPDIYGEGTSQISDMHFQIALTSQYVASFG